MFPDAQTVVMTTQKNGNFNSDEDVCFHHGVNDYIAWPYDRLSVYARINYQIKYFEHLYDAMNLDPKLKIYNFAAFKRILLRSWEQSEKHNFPLSLVILDIDFFGRFNETYGHPEGDIALMKVAQAIKGAIRATDAVARYGGEEFAVILPGEDYDGCTIVGERLLEAIRNLRIVHADSEIPERILTVSIGSATKNKYISDCDELIKEADDKMFEAKTAGRNCFFQ
jgi:diguanylate cyclase (GGDEF)-like protein